jgi:hypothetical protein
MTEERESSFHGRAIQYLRSAVARHGGWVGTIPGGDRRVTRSPGYVRGTPDILCVVFGEAWLIELKSVRGVVEPHQKAVHGDLERAGARVCIARSMPDLESIVRAISTRPTMRAA